MRKRILFIYGVSITLGCLTGLIGSLFQLSIYKLSDGISYILAIADTHHLPVALCSSLITLVFVMISFWAVKLIAPEASGSGVQEIEGTLLHERPIFWKRLLPVKFFAGVLAISAKMVMGREGPTIQMGGNLGVMLSQWLNLSIERRDTLIAAGAAAGLATAFNAPLAGVLFVIEEMRSGFVFSFENFKIVAISCVMATIVLHLIIGSAPVIPMNIYEMPALKTLWVFFAFGILIGFVGLYFNHILMFTLNTLDRTKQYFYWIYVPFVGLLVGFLAQYYPETVGGGYEIIHKTLSISLPLNTLIILFGLRFITTMLCYSSRVPGGIFAPMLALGTILGLATYQLLQLVYSDMSIHPGMFAVAGMGALFAAAVRAPLTGIVLVVEMTQNYMLILPLMITCLTATTIVQLAANPPIYTQLLERTLRLCREEDSDATPPH